MSSLRASLASVGSGKWKELRDEEEEDDGAVAPSPATPLPTKSSSSSRFTVTVVDSSPQRHTPIPPASASASASASAASSSSSSSSASAASAGRASTPAAFSFSSRNTRSNNSTTAGMRIPASIASFNHLTDIAQPSPRFLKAKPTFSVSANTATSSSPPTPSPFAASPFAVTPSSPGDDDSDTDDMFHDMQNGKARESFAMKPLGALYAKNPTIALQVPDETETKKKPKLSTFSGVYVPTCESMWGVIIFLRFGVLTGQGGVGFALLAVVLSAVCVLLCTMSLCAVGTNGKTPQGGTYYILTRSMGPALGGSVGLLYYIGLTVMSTVEVVGFTEGLHIILQEEAGITSITGNAYWDQVLIGFIVLVLLCVGSFIGVSFVHHIGLVFLSGLILAYLAGFIGLFASSGGWATGSVTPPASVSSNATLVITGLSIATLKDNWSSNYTNNWSFSTVMTFIFPCFIGIFSGADLSGELRKPFHSIPRGTFAAIATSCGLYSAIILLLGSVAVREVLKLVELTFASVAWPSPWVTLIGILLVSLGSAIQLLTIAPRILQAIAQDGLLPPIRVFGFDRLWSNEPRRALFCTFFLALPFIFLSSLDTIATIVTMCFLLCYAMMNFACFLLSILRTPEWRPQYKYYHWSLAFIGFVFCIALMFYIEATAAIASIIVTVAICIFIQIVGSKAIWGSGIRGLQFHVALISLLGIEQEDFEHDIADTAAHDGGAKLSKVVTGDAKEPVSRSASDTSEHSSSLKPGADDEHRATAGTKGKGFLQSHRLSGKFSLKALSLLGNKAAVEGPAADEDSAENTLDPAVVHALKTGGGGGGGGGGGTVDAAGKPADDADADADAAADHAKASKPTGTWRPQILCFDQVYDNGQLAHPGLLAFVHQLKETRGLTMVATVLPTRDLVPEPPRGVTNFEKYRTATRRATHAMIVEKVAEKKRILRQKMKEYRIMGFAEVVFAPTFEIGKSILLQTAGLGGMKPNTIVTGWPHNWRKNPETARGFLDTFEELRASDKALLVVKGLSLFPSISDTMAGTIDIWWIVQEGGLLLLVAHLLTRHRVWKKCRLRLFTVAELNDNSVSIERELKSMLDHLRIPAEVKVVEMPREDFDPFTNDWTVRGKLAHPSSKKGSFFPTLVDEIPGVAHSQRAPPALDGTELAESSTLGQDASADGVIAGTGMTLNEQRELMEQQAHAPALMEEASGPFSSLTIAAIAAASKAGSSSVSLPPGGSNSSKGKQTVHFSPSSLELGSMAEERAASGTTNRDERSRKQQMKQWKSFLKINATGRLKTTIESESLNSSLVLLNLPVPDEAAFNDPAQWMNLIELLTENLPRVVLVHGANKQAVSFYG